MKKDINRRQFIATSSAALLASVAGCSSKSSVPFYPKEFSKSIQRIVAGSCLDQKLPSPVLKTIYEMHPNIFLMMGDNIYADTFDMSILRREYQKLEKNPYFEKIQSESQFLATWDDHDFGVNDSGGDFPVKRQSQEIFMDFMKEPLNSWRRNTPGVYDSYEYFTDGRILRIILLDTRYFRDPLVVSKKALPYPGKFEPNEDPHSTLLGSDQWMWLERELMKPADLSILVSSIQVLPTQHGWEKWGNFPHERDRLLKLINRSPTPVFILSGDRHKAAIYQTQRDNGSPLIEVTTSSLNKPLPQKYHQPDPSFFRLGDEVYDANFASLDFHWESLKLVASIRNPQNQIKASKTFLFSKDSTR